MEKAQSTNSEIRMKRIRRRAWPFREASNNHVLTRQNVILVLLEVTKLEAIDDFESGTDPEGVTKIFTKLIEAVTRQNISLTKCR